MLIPKLTIGNGYLLICGIQGPLFSVYNYITFEYSNHLNTKHLNPGFI